MLPGPTDAAREAGSAEAVTVVLRDAALAKASSGVSLLLANSPLPLLSNSPLPFAA